MMAFLATSPSPKGLQALASSVPLGQRGLVHVWGRNDTSVAQKLGISWVVRDPDGGLVEQYSTWQMFTTSPGDSHEFIGGRFDLDKEGTYALAVNLLMNPDSPVIVDTYEGDLCTVVAEVIPPEYEPIQHNIHPAAYVYEGDAEVCVIEFPLGPEQLPFTQWGGLKLADAFASAVEAEGNSLLWVKVWEDTTPMFWTNYRVEIKAAVAPERGIAAPVWPWLIAIGAVLASLPWKAIIVGTLSVLGIWVVGWVIEKLIKSVDRVVHRPPTLTDEVIEGLGREDLIPMILYMAPRVEYEVSPEDLEQMTDDGLRALLKELRDRQGPPPIEWWPLALVGVGVLGVGAAVAYAMVKSPKENDGG